MQHLRPLSLCFLDRVFQLGSFADPDEDGLHPQSAIGLFVLVAHRAIERVGRKDQLAYFSGGWKQFMQ